MPQSSEKMARYRGGRLYGGGDDGKTEKEVDKYEEAKKYRKKKGMLVPVVLVSILGLIVLIIRLISDEQERRGVKKETPDKERDIMLSSFPKSGSNWVRFLVAGLEAGRYERATGKKLELTFEMAEFLVPDLEFGPNREQFKSGGKIPAYKSHQPYVPRHRAAGVGPSDHGSRGRPRCDEAPYKNMERYQCLCPNCPTRWQNFLVVVRDGRSALCSYLNFQRQLGNVAPETTLADFLLSDKSHYGLSWPDHVLSFLDIFHAENTTNKAKKNIFILKYEDLHANPLVKLQELAQWFNRSYTNLDLQGIIDQSAFDNMRAIEEQSGTPLFDAAYPEARDRGFRLVRDGKADGWRSCDTNETRINALFRAHLPNFDLAMRRLGYFS